MGLRAIGPIAELPDPRMSGSEKLNVHTYLAGLPLPFFLSFLGFLLRCIKRRNRFGSMDSVILSVRPNEARMIDGVSAREAILGMSNGLIVFPGNSKFEIVCWFL